MMATAKKIVANRKNAQRSTGPRTTTGEVIAKRNAVSHGLSSLLPVIRGEKHEDWEAHRLAIIDSIVPCGAVEAELAERIALVTWRLRRVVRYETESMGGPIPRVDGNTANNQDADIDISRRLGVIDVEHRGALENYELAVRMKTGYHQVQTLWDGYTLDGPVAVALLFRTRDYVSLTHDTGFDTKSSSFLSDLGVPADWHGRLDRWDGWTNSILRKGLSSLAERNGMDLDQLLDKAERNAETIVAKSKTKLDQLESELNHIRNQYMMKFKEKDDPPEETGLVLDQTSLDKVMRYESHLTKQLLLTLNELKSLQYHRFRSSQMERDQMDEEAEELKEEKKEMPAAGAVLVEAQG